MKMETISVSERRQSQSDWYHNRGRTRANVTCEGSSAQPTKITSQGDYVAGTGSGRMKGTLPKGVCPVCEDEISLNVKGSDDGDVFTLRKHKDSKAPYKRSILISEETWRSLNLTALKTENKSDEQRSDDPNVLKNLVDDLADNILKDNL